MNDEVKVEKKPENATDVIKDIADVKKNMVPKEEYEKILADNAKYKHALLNGVLEVDSEESKSAAELREDYSKAIKEGVTNVEGFETALKLRQAVIDETGKDPFMTEALERIDPDFGDRVSGIMKEMVEASGGSPQMFNALLSQNIK